MMSLIFKSWKFLSTPSARRATCAALRCFTKPTLFLSTPSARRATFLLVEFFFPVGISIHALREEGDSQHRRFYNAQTISIHALREEGDSCRPAR